MSIQDATQQQSRQRKSSRFTVAELLRTIVLDDQTGTETEHKAKCKRLLTQEGYENYLDDAVTFAIAWFYKQAYQDVFPATMSEVHAQAADRRAAKKQADIKHRRAVGLVKRTMIARLLDSVTPNGKPLRYCTGTECTQFGGWYCDIGKKVGTRIVGQMMQESELQALFERRTLGD